MSKRTGKGFEPRFDEKQLARFGKGKPRIISIWNDLFHECVTDDEIIQTLIAMFFNDKNIYLVLTKRADRLLKLKGAWFGQEKGARVRLYNMPNLWLGVTAENQARWGERVPQLLAANPAHPWVMCEPLLEEIKRPRNIEKLHWVVAGEETGKSKRTIEEAVLRALLWDADAAAVPFWGKAGYGEGDRAYPPALLHHLGKH
jgi:protein gp37